MSRRETPAPNVFGWDIQSIPWNLSRLTREEYREQRLAEYAALELRRQPVIYNGPDVRIGRELSEATGEVPLYRFRHLNRSLPCTATHFQLRHLVWSPLATSVLFSYASSVIEWDPISGEEVPRINFRLAAGAYTRITSMCATPDLILIGGFYGELLVTRTLDDNGGHPSGATSLVRASSSVQSSQSHSEQANRSLLRLTREENGITNHIKVWPGETGRFTISSNDAHVRLFDAGDMRVTNLYEARTAVNATAIHPHGNLLSVASDQTAVDLIDVRTGKEVMQLIGHVGYTFSCDWSNDGRWLATGNEDHTTRIWDIRGTSVGDGSSMTTESSSLHILGSRMAAVRNVLFSPDCPSTLTMMEESDYVTIYNVDEAGLFERCTTVDFFGEVSGISYSPDGEYLYLGCGEMERGGLMEFERSRSSLLRALEKTFLS